MLTQLKQYLTGPDQYLNNSYTFNSKKGNVMGEC